MAPNDILNKFGRLSRSSAQTGFASSEAMLWYEAIICSALCEEHSKSSRDTVIFSWDLYSRTVNINIDMKARKKDDYLLIEIKSRHFQNIYVFMQKCFTQNECSISILYYLERICGFTIECVHNWN